MKTSPPPILDNAQLYVRCAGIFTLVYAAGVVVMLEGYGIAHGLSLDYGIFINAFLMWIVGCPYAWLAFIPLLMVEEPFAAQSEEWRVGFSFGLHLLITGIFVWLHWGIASGCSPEEVADIWRMSTFSAAIAAGIASFTYSVLKTRPHTQAP